MPVIPHTQSHAMNRPLLLIALACTGLTVLIWGGIRTLQGPALTGYQLTAQPLVQTVVATGRVAALSRAQVGSQVTGVVIERRVTEGDVVAPGDVLAVLRADDLVAAVNEAEAALAELQQSSRPQAQAALLDAQARLTQASREARRRQELLGRQMISREVMEQAVQAETSARAALERAQLAARTLQAGQASELAAQARVASARAQLAKTTIRAELAGTVLTRNAEPGDLVQPGVVLFDIARTGGTEVLVPLDEKNLEVLALGQLATCVADAYPTRPFKARVDFIAPTVDPQRGTVDVRLSVDPAPDFLLEGMTVSVNIETGRRDNALAVPNDALTVVDGEHAEVWRVVDGQATRRKVRLGLRGLTQTEISAGLQAGDWILADAQAPISDGDLVRMTATAKAPFDSQSRNELPARLD
ncbi:MAG: efflux RND transporter periplasmic adaptor subunit [Gammaproteobacteria bacterium]|nr:efflux RND transporter periplasmic adaptor subunit [Gammaproteobacteria bacterium]MBU1772941.1 efflux RND transporter periplasmic adaptor subunit [Gammaproteobacteria bacterium]